MKRTNTKRLAAALAGLATALMAGSAPAAVWHWACRGETGGQRVMFDQDGLYIAAGNEPAAPPGKLTMESVTEPIVLLRKGGDFTEFGLPEGNDGLGSKVLTFPRTDDNKQEQKVTFTARSSKLISHRHRMVACRDEDTDLYRKVYRYERDGEPARDIAMQCMEYQLSTKGGRTDCGD
jgi:hypothetical protein